MIRGRVALFLKNPEPGATKTRLGATIGHERAVEIYKRLVERTLSQLPWETQDIAIHYSPADAEQPIRDWLQPLAPNGARIDFRAQCDGDLGQRLADSVASAIAENRPSVTLVGADCPDLVTDHYDQAVALLGSADAVFGPTEDGGYYLLALGSAATTDLFVDIPWSTGNTLQASLDRATAAGLETHLLEKLWDIDTEDDLQKTRWNKFYD